ncbi:DUF5677 domain-containing protein [Paraburkholderia haematera]|uniref:Uncharacterized protein n=1 Tax=Paraburkholderia haematera TaxID=2793077 RepID=A0ABN7LJW0_9BURK|nr:DUF5677 domain-containing protein [Paraburkholderia haematera]CAE6754636.1 hypothetical protein R69888_03124 [Paraburkholderia haematera]
MHIIQPLLEKQLKEIPRLIMSNSIKEKLLAAGVDPSETLVDQLVEHSFSGNTEPFTWDDGEQTESMGTKNVTLSFSDEDVANVEETCARFLENIPTMIEEVSGDIAKSLLKTLKKNWKEEYSLQIRDEKGFRRRLEKRWGKALGKLRMLLTISIEQASEAAKTESPDRSQSRDVLHRLHVRACQVTREIITLMENGFADGAMARWRTLHEISVVTVLLVEHGEPLAERYVAHRAIEAKAGKDQFLLCYEQLGYAPLDPDECREIDEAYDRAIAKFGKEFRTPYGWAFGFVQKNSRGVVGLGELEAAAGRSALASHYKLASHNVHAGPHALFFRLGLMGEPGLLAGASNAGLMEPGQNTAVSLALISILLANDRDTLDGVVTMKLVQILKYEIGEEFAKAERKLQEDHARYTGEAG